MVGFGFTHRAHFDIPKWAGLLNNLYWIIRANRRNAARKRKAYHAIRKEKLRLVEAGVRLDEINAVCKYLVSLKQVNADRAEAVFMSQSKQLCFDFYVSAI